MVGRDESVLVTKHRYLMKICDGGVVDEDAQLEALGKGRIAGGALEVFTSEPLQEDSPLCELDNVILTPHIGGGTGTNRALELGDALDEVRRVLGGATPRVDLG